MGPSRSSSPGTARSGFASSRRSGRCRCSSARTGGVLALGGGAIESARTRERLSELATTVWLDVPVDEAWRRAQGTPRPLAQDEAEFRARYERRRPLYEAAADFVARDVDDLVLAAGGIHVEVGALERLGELVPGDGPVELVSDTRVAGIYGMDVQLALGARITASHELPQGEEAKTVAAVERLWQSLRLERGGTLLALGGGCTTDAAGFAAAAYMRGIDWVAVPTTLVGQVDAAIGGKTAIDLPGGKNLVGAFHWPVRTVIDPGTLETLPDTELENGRAELVKTGLLAGRAVLGAAAARGGAPLRRASRQRSACAIRTTAASARSSTSGTRSPTRSRRRPASSCRTGSAVALGLLAALRLSGLDTASGRGDAAAGAGAASTATARGPRSPATRRPSAACRGSSCSTRPAARGSASSCPRTRSVPLSTL